MLTTAPARGTNTVLVGHSHNLIAATGVGLAEGEAAVYRPDGAGGSDLLDRRMAEDW